MSSSVPRPLPENAGFIFTGEPEWAPAVITARQAEILSTTPNPTGRPNTDVLRGYIGATVNGTAQRWQVDFPAHLTVQEAALYEEPFARLQSKLPGATGTWWVNPHAYPTMRNALARVQRYLATPFAFTAPLWTWVEGDWLPDETLVAVARDDDFTHAVLQSRIFAQWWSVYCEDYAAMHLVEAFPFPWSPLKPVGSLTGIQQDLRYAAARAVRSGEQVEIDTAVATAYGWPVDLDENELMHRLRELHQRRMA